MAIYKDRKSVPVSETWDIDSLLAKKTIDQNFEECLKALNSLMVFYKIRYKSVNDFVAYTKQSYEVSKILDKVALYLRLKLAENTIDANAAQKFGELDLKIQPFMIQLAGSEAEDIENQALIEKYLKDDRLKDERPRYKKFFEKAKHELQKNEAVIISRLNGAFQNSNEVFDVLTNSEIKYENALDSKNKKHEVTNQTYHTQMQQEDRILRKNVFNSRNKGILAFKETLSKLLSTYFLSSYRFAQLHKYEDNVVASIDKDNVKIELVENLYKFAKANLAPYKNFYKAKQEYLKTRIKAQPETYDQYLKLVKSSEKFSVAKSIELVLASIKPLGKEYEEAAKKALKERWIDFHMTPNKISGAFSSGNKWHEKKYILCNHDETLNSVFTLAHEMGHSMHTHFNNVSNCPANADYPIFIAEVASNFSELLLMEEMLRTSKNEKTKFVILEQFIDNFVGNVYRQLEFSEYEYVAMKSIKSNKAINNWPTLSKMYYDVMIQYSPREKTPEFKEERTLAAIIIPHHYYNFYVYKYSIGMIGALRLMSILKKDQKSGAQNYINFIKSGNQNWPVDILKLVQVDLNKEDTYKEAFQLFAHYVDEFINIGNKIFNKK